MEPGIDIEIVASNAPIDLKRREADIAVRSFRPTQSELIAKKIKDAAARLYATPQYLERIGNPTSPHGLGKADFIGFDSTDALLNALNAFGFNLTQRNFPVLTESHLVLWELVKHGVGVGLMAEDIGDAEPMVQRALPNLEPMRFPIWLVAHRELNTSRRISMVFDLLATELSDDGPTRPATPQYP